MDNFKRFGKIKTINNPSVKDLSIALAPFFVMFVITMIKGKMLTWALVVSVVSLLSYAGLIVYFCIKQRCYKQMAYNLLFLILFGLGFILIHI